MISGRDVRMGRCGCGTGEKWKKSVGLSLDHLTGSGVKSTALSLADRRAPPSLPGEAPHMSYSGVTMEVSGQQRRPKGQKKPS